MVRLHVIVILRTSQCGASTTISPWQSYILRRTRETKEKRRNLISRVSRSKKEVGVVYPRYYWSSFPYGLKCLYGRLRYFIPNSQYLGDR